MKRLTVLLCAMILVCGLTGTARADSFLLQNVTSSTGWFDVYQGAGTNYCWLASASNMLAYAGWDGGAGLTTADQIFGYSTPYWENLNGNPYYGVEWWFDGQNNHPTTGTWPNVSGGGNFYGEAVFAPGGTPVIGFDEDLTAQEVHDYLAWDVANNRVFTMLLGTGSVGTHFLTGWGYETAGGDIAGVYFTDSFNQFGGLQYSSLTCSTGNCYLAGYETVGYLITMESLAFNIGDIPPNPPPAQVPEPATLLLLGTGLSGLLVFRRRR